MINDMGITVFETAPDADNPVDALEATIRQTRVAAAEAAAALASVESNSIAPPIRCACICVRWGR